MLFTITVPGQPVHAYILDKLFTFYCFPQHFICILGIPKTDNGIVQKRSRKSPIHKFSMKMVKTF